MSQEPNEIETRHPYELADRVVVVTGASSGIGWHTARKFASNGAHVALVARREDRLRALADEITAAGGAAFVAPADLSVAGEAATLAARLAADVGEIDVLVNNAGSGVGGRVWAVADHEEARRFFEVNLWSPLALIGATVPGMRRRQHGAIVNLTSLRTVLPWPSFGHSSAACAAMSMITETLRLELARFRVDVVEVIPGPIETPAQGPTKLLPGFVEAVHARLGTAEPDELARMIVEAVIERRPSVFCPKATTRAVYEDPTGVRADIIADALEAARGDTGLPDELLDTFVVGGDHPLIADAREQWERERAQRSPA